MVLTTPVEMHTALSAKNAYALLHARMCNSVGCHGSYCELTLSLARASWRLSFVARSCCPSCCLDQAVSTKPVAWRCLLKKSVQIHASSWCGRRCGVALASSNHLRWCRTHPVCVWVALALDHGGHCIKKSILHFLRESLLQEVYSNTQWVNDKSLTWRPRETTIIEKQQHSACTEKNNNIPLNPSRLP